MHHLGNSTLNLPQGRENFKKLVSARGQTLSSLYNKMQCFGEKSQYTPPPGFLQQEKYSSAPCSGCRESVITDGIIAFRDTDDNTL
jgi:hypothetical protein